MNSSPVSTMFLNVPSRNRVDSLTYDLFIHSDALKMLSNFLARDFSNQNINRLSTFKTQVKPVTLFIKLKKRLLNINPLIYTNLFI